MSRRYILFAVSLFVNAMGIAFITKALLGTSPITSVTYVLSMFTPLTIGQWTIVLNLLFVLFELPFMTRKEFKGRFTDVFVTDSDFFMFWYVLLICL